MTTLTKIVLFLAAIITLTILFSSPLKLSGETIVVPVATSTPQLSYQQKAWLGALEWCESRGNPQAVNPKDRDNTPSYGLLQFKPGTFNYYSQRYGIATTSYMAPDEQILIVTQMILRNDVNWHQQFPECTRQLGNPPKNAKI